MRAASGDGHAIDLATARRLVAEQFPLLASLEMEPVAQQGWDNRCFRVGEAYVARFPAATAYAPQVVRLERWLPRLSGRLDIEVPAFVAKGSPGQGYSHDWAILGWIEGEPCGPANLAESPALAGSVGTFLAEMQKLPVEGGPQPGPQNFFRGGPLRVYESAARKALALVGGRFEAARLQRVLDRALASENNTKSWIHGDLSPDNLILRHGCLAGMIDWGLTAVGDPACDLAFGWSWLSGRARDAFLDASGADLARRERARGWALWKAAILCAGVAKGPADQVARSGDVLEMLSRDSA